MAASRATRHVFRPLRRGDAAAAATSALPSPPPATILTAIELVEKARGTEAADLFDPLVGLAAALIETGDAARAVAVAERAAAIAVPRAAVPQPAPVEHDIDHRDLLEPQVGAMRYRSFAGGASTTPAAFMTMTNQAAALLLAMFLASGGVLAQETQPADPGAAPAKGAMAAPPKGAWVDEAGKLAAEGGRLFRAGKYDEALPVVRRVLTILEKEVGPDDILVAPTLMNLGWLLRSKGDDAGAELNFRRALAIKEKRLGADHVEVAGGLDAVALVVQARGDYPTAEALFRRALTIREKAYGPEHVEVATSLENLGGLLGAKGDYSGAEPLLRRGLAIKEKALGPDDEGLSSCLNNLASLLQERADYAGAEALYRRSLAIDEKAYGPEHPEVATTLANLATVLHDRGDLGGAERLDRRALAIREKSLGPEHPYVAIVLGNMAVLLQDRGDFAAAEPLQRRAMAIREKSLGPEHSLVATDLVILARMLVHKGDTAGAEAAYRRALHIKEKTLGPDHPEVGTVLSDLGVLLFNDGDSAGAEPLFRRDLAITEKVLGPEHPLVASALNNLASVLQERGENAGAERLYRRALAIDERLTGPEHPRVATILTNLASVLIADGKVEAGMALHERSADIAEKLLAVLLYAGGAREKLAYFSQLESSTNGLVSLQVHELPNDASALRLALTTVLRRKGRALEASVDTMQALRRAAASDDVAKLDRLASLRSDLAAHVLQGPSPGQSVESHAAAIDKLRAQTDALDSELGNRYAALRRPSDPVTIESVQRRLDPGASLVELYRYQRFNPENGSSTRWGSWRYVAYVIPAAGAPSWTELGEAEPIDTLVAQARQLLSNADSGYVAVARALDERLMRPIRALLRDSRDVYLSPDGALNLVPFAALVDEHQRFLISSYRFTVLTSGRDLLRLQTRGVSASGPVIVAGPDYGRTPSDEKPTPPSPGQRSLDMGSVPFSPLPGAEREGRELAGLVRGARLLSGGAATEEAVKALRAPRFLHIATHGFFLGNPVRSSGGRGAQLIETQGGAFTQEDPLLRSGLALAGANLRRAGAEDGILTALEVAGLDLWGTELVVLSACETGVGTVTNGDGIYGLRRALILAGSETQVISLWKVSDEATRLLMTDYYRRLTAGAGRSDALREAQLALFSRPDLRHPTYWATFVASGDQRSLDGRPPPPVRQVTTPGVDGRPK